MKLTTKLNNLKKERKPYEVKTTEIYLFKLDDYKSSEVMRNFWIGLCVAIILGFIASLIIMGAHDAQVRGQNPEIVKLQNEREAAEKQHELDVKDQYIKGCKDTGKAPGNMGGYEPDWSCK